MESSSQRDRTSSDGRSDPNKALKPYRKIDYEALRSRGNGR